MDFAKLRKDALDRAHDFEGVKEEPLGSNKGAWVSRFLKAVGVVNPAPWCASFVSYCYILVGGKAVLPPNPFRVRSWAKWAKEKGWIISWNEVKAGDLFFWLIPPLNLQGHLGFVANVNEVYGKDGKAYKVIVTLEGNYKDQVGSRVISQKSRPGLKFIRVGGK